MYLGRFDDVRPEEYCFQDCVSTVRRPWRALQSEPLVTVIGVDTAEDGPLFKKVEREDAQLSSQAY